MYLFRDRYLKCKLSINNDSRKKWRHYFSMQNDIVLGIQGAPMRYLLKFIDKE